MSVAINTHDGMSFELLTNIEQTDINHDALPLYLSPDFVPTEDEIHDPMAFPSFRFMKEMVRKVEAGELIPQAFDERTLITQSRERSLQRPEVIWPHLKKAWRLHDAGQYQLSNRILNQIVPSTLARPATLGVAQFDFLQKIVPLESSIHSEVNSIKQSNPKEFSRFLLDYQVRLRKEHQLGFFEILSEYFDCYHDFSQVSTYLLFGTPFPDKARATSTNFTAVRSFYASVYEFYAGAIQIYTCLNNIKKGRRFDELAKINLEKYLTTDKAERRKSLENNPIFYKNTAEYNSNIRNASFHNWFRIKESGTEIEFRSGGTGATQTISYAQYLYKCSILLGQVCQLFMTELNLDAEARTSALVKTS